MAVLAGAACAHAGVPDGRVLNRDLRDWVYGGRFQKVEDVQIVLAGNAAVGFVAIYQRRDTVGRRDVPRTALVVAFVTEYERAGGVASALLENLANQEGYREWRDRHVLRLIGTMGDSWAFWPSGRFVVKVGALAGKEPPGEVLSAYLSLYPSDLR
jgi:hypothetical protein